MKKTLLLLTALFASIGLTTAQTLSIPDVYVRQGGTASFALVVDVPANSYVGFQFDTTFPTGINYTGTTTVSAGWDGSFSTSTINYKGSSNSGTLTPIPSGERIIATAEITADASMTLDEYTVTISNFEFLGYSEGAADKMIEPVTFKVIVTDRTVLDETSTLAPAAESGVNVTVKRTIKAGEWSTICLPFAMNKSQADAAFGSGYVVKQYTGYTATIDESTLIPSAITVNFSEYTLNALRKINAGTPYLIKTTKDIESFDVDGVNISTVLNDVSGAETNYGLTGMFKGVLAKTTVPNNGLFISDNKFYYSNGNTNIKAFRGWFNLEAVLNVAVGAPVFINIDGETTGIENIQRTTGDDRYYNLNGQHVENLKKGQIYIKNNKKVVVK